MQVTNHHHLLPQLRTVDVRTTDTKAIMATRVTIEKAATNQIDMPTARMITVKVNVMGVVGVVGVGRFRSK